MNTKADERHEIKSHIYKSTTNYNDITTKHNPKKSIKKKKGFFFSDSTFFFSFSLPVTLPIHIEYMLKRWWWTTYIGKCLISKRDLPTTNHIIAAVVAAAASPKIQNNIIIRDFTHLLWFRIKSRDFVFWGWGRKEHLVDKTSYMIIFSFSESIRFNIFGCFRIEFHSQFLVFCALLANVVYTVKIGIQ